jgi:hypothetical protein
MKALLLANGILFSMFLSTACAKTDPEAETAPADMANASSVELPDATVAKPKNEQPQYEFTDAMRVPVDGSSLESFEQSLESIKSKAEAAEYKTLTGAIDYLLIYDIGARHDRAKLAQRLDGLTGEEIVNRVAWDRKPSRK